MKGKLRGGLARYEDQMRALWVFVGGAIVMMVFMLCIEINK